MAQQVNDWKQKIHQRVADLIKGMKDGLNMNEDLSNKQVSTSTSDVCTSSARDKEAARKGKQAMELEDIKGESDEEYFDNFSKKFQRWSEFKKNGGEIASKKKLTTWEELDKLSEEEKKVKLPRRSRPEVQARPEAAAESEVDSESEHSSYDSDQDILNQVYSQLPKLELIKLLNAGSRKFKKLKVNCEHLSEQASQFKCLYQEALEKIEVLEKGNASSRKPYKNSIDSKDLCNTHIDSSDIISLLSSLKNNGVNGIGYSCADTNEKPSSSSIFENASPSDLYSTFVPESFQVVQMENKGQVTNSLGPICKWVPKDKIVYLAAGQMRKIDSPLTWTHGTANGRRAIVHRRHIFDESDGEEDEEYEACSEDDSNSAWRSNCSGYDTDFN